MTRAHLAAQIVGAIGADVAHINRPGTGWPSCIDVETAFGRPRVSLHVSRASPHSRRPYEWRFQNPGNRLPVSDADGIAILVGIDSVDGTDVLVAVDGTSRVGRATRFSILFNKRISKEASVSGWSEQLTSSGETIYALLPSLFPLLVEMLVATVAVPATSIIGAVRASGTLNDTSPPARDRLRRTLSAFVRDVRFSRDVRIAYEQRCAMCGVGLDLIVGAHILPVSAPGAPDKVWNGLALCQNHHLAFDRFNIWIDSDYTLQIRRQYIDSAKNDESRRFLTQTKSTLWVPRNANERPRAQMLHERYLYYEQEYEWAPSLAA